MQVGVAITVARGRKYVSLAVLEKSTTPVVLARPSREAFRGQTRDITRLISLSRALGSTAIYTRRDSIHDVVSASRRTQMTKGGSRTARCRRRGCGGCRWRRRTSPRGKLNVVGVNELRRAVNYCGHSKSNRQSKRIGYLSVNIYETAVATVIQLQL